jgi:DNA polymerase-3 subunit epsilon
LIRRLLNRVIPAGLRGWPAEDAPLVALDAETTGLDPESATLLSLGAVPIDGRRVLLSDRFEAMIQREGPTHEGSVRIHRLRAIDLATGLQPSEALERFREWLGDRSILGYCVEFDRGVLNRALREDGHRGLDVPAYDLRQLYRLKRKDHVEDPGHGIDLDGILADAGIPPLARHTALGDAVATALAYLALRYGRQRGGTGS